MYKKRDKLIARDFIVTNFSTYDFSTLYTTLPHYLIKEKNDLIKITTSEGSPYLACNDRNAFSLLNSERTCQNVCDALAFLLDNIFYTSCRQVAGVIMGITCAPLVSVLFLFL